MLKLLRSLFGLLLLLCVTAGCAAELPRESEVVPRGNPQRGAELVVSHGCVSCHAIPEISRTKSYVGPPLERWPERNFIAGQYANTPANLVAWIRNPQELRPGSAMPDMGVGRQDAADIAAFLFELDGEPVHWLEHAPPVVDR